MGSSIWSSKGPTCEPSSTSLVVNVAATIRPVSAFDTNVQFAPRPAPARTVLLDQPFAGARQFQPSAVHQQMHGLGARRTSRPRSRLAPPAQRGMVRDSEIETEQADDGADQPF